jgi:SP family arabinose:H+ symporter-like MFS transporter
MALIDKLGRKPILIFGVTGIAAFMFLLAYGFDAATYTLSTNAISGLSSGIDQSLFQHLENVTFHSDVEFKRAVEQALGPGGLQQYESEIITAAISMNPTLILVGILGFVASFAISIGPVMWVLFAELFPNRIRGLAISFVGLVNSAVSFLVQLLFPWQLANIGNAGTFLIYGLFAVVGLLIIAKLLPETKGKSLEEIEELLVGVKRGGV